MRTPRLYVTHPPIEGHSLDLDERAAGHLVRVLRARSGQPVVLFDGSGREWDATVSVAARREARVHVGDCRASTTESPLATTLVQGISRGERMDFVLQKATELGVTRIVPVVTSRSVVRLDEERAQSRMDHWRGVLIAACEQCGRNVLPELVTPVALDAWLAIPGEGMRLLLDPRAATALGTLPAALDHVSLLIGPEGGLDEREVAHAQRAGYVGVRLGPRVLRTETAALVALAVLQARFGDLS